MCMHCQGYRERKENKLYKIHNEIKMKTSKAQAKVSSQRRNKKDL